MESWVKRAGGLRTRRDHFSNFRVDRADSATVASVVHESPVNNVFILESSNEKCRIVDSQSQKIYS